MTCNNYYSANKSTTPVSFTCVDNCDSKKGGTQRELIDSYDDTKQHCINKCADAGHG